MIITGVQPRKKSLLALYIDGEFAIDIDRTTFLESEFSEGSKLTDEQLHSLIALSSYNRAYQKAIYLLSIKDYFSKDLIDKIKRDNGEEAAIKACERMQELGYVNDEALARRYAKDLTNRKGYSRKKAEYELKRKGIDEYLIEELLEEVAPDPKEKVIDIINRKYINKLDDEKLYRRTVSALMRLGYSYDIIKDAIDEIRIDK